MQPPFFAYDYISGKEPFLFISYAHTDAIHVYPIIQQFYTRGIRIWYDEGIEPSVEWLAKIANAINFCSIFIVFISKASMERNNVVREILHALKRYDKKEIQFIPIYLEETVLPEGIDLGISPIQAIMKHKISDDSFFAKLYSSLNPTVFQSKSQNQKRKTTKKSGVSKPEIEFNNETLIDFRGVMLEESEHNIIIEFEKLVGPIPLEEGIGDSTFGLVIKDYHVIGLGLAGKKLTTIPDGIDKLTHLELLNVAHNKLTSIPENIEDFHSMIALNLGKNKISSLPETICNLESLSVLQIDKNKLTSLPNNIGNLRSLETLDLRDNQLTILPESIGNLINLSELSMSGNRLISLPNTIGNLKSLDLLELNDNPLNLLPESIANLANLTTLDISSVTPLPESIGQLKKLNQLAIAGDSIPFLPHTLINIKSLKEVSIFEEATYPKSVEDVLIALKKQRCKIRKF